MNAIGHYGPASFVMCLGLLGPAVAARAVEPEIKPTAQFDLDYGSYDAEQPTVQRNVTAGLTYYWIEHLRIMLNHIDVHSERWTRADNPNLLLMRVQLAL